VPFKLIPLVSDLLRVFHLPALEHFNRDFAFENAERKIFTHPWMMFIHLYSRLYGVLSF